MKTSYLFSNFRLIFMALWRFFMHGSATANPGNPKSILIMQTSQNLGDMACITPMFRAIKQKYPECKLYLMSRGKAVEILKGNPHIDEYISNTGKASELVRKLKTYNIDFATCTNPSTAGLAVLYLSGIPCISTFSFDKPQTVFSRAYFILKKMVIEIPFKVGDYVPKQYLNLLKPIEIESDNPRPELFYTREADETVSKLFSEKNINFKDDIIVAIAPGGSLESRWWGSEKYALLTDYLFNKYEAKIFFVGAGQDKVPIDETIRFLNRNTRYINLLNQPLEEFKAFISKASLVIGNDSGPMTLAKAFAVPEVVFVGPTDERANHLPSGKFNRVVKSSTRGEPITDSSNWTNFDEIEARRQMNEITIDDAIREIEIVLKSLGK